MRLEKIINNSGYSLNVRGSEIDVYDLRKESLPEDLKEVKIVGRTNSKDPWIELTRLGDATQYRPFLSTRQENVLTFSENDFAHYNNSLSL